MFDYFISRQEKYGEMYRITIFVSSSMKMSSISPCYLVFIFPHLHACQVFISFSNDWLLLIAHPWCSTFLHWIALFSLPNAYRWTWNPKMETCPQKSFLVLLMFSLNNWRFNFLNSVKDFGIMRRLASTIVNLSDIFLWIEQSRSAVGFRLDRKTSAYF